MGNVVLEAMASGCAVVAPHAGGIPNLVLHGSTGFLFRPRETKDALTWTQAVLDDPQLRMQISQAARQAIEDRNWEQSIGRVRQAYLQAIEQPKQVASNSKWSEHVANIMTKTLVSLFRSTSDRRKHVRRTHSLSKAAA